jgi:hypothetical protein
MLGTLCQPVDVLDLLVYILSFHGGRARPLEAFCMMDNRSYDACDDGKPGERQKKRLPNLTEI